jgi:hypothetical protein
VSKAEEKAIARQFERLKVAYLANERFKVWLAEQKNPPAPPKPVEPPMSLARAAAIGKIKVPELGNYTERERMLTYRAEMRDALNHVSRDTIGMEAEQKLRAFEVEEKARWKAASVALNRGLAPGHVAAHFHLTEAEVENIQDQLSGRIEPKPKPPLADCGF